MPARVVRALLVDPHALAAEQLRRDLWGHPMLSVVGIVRTAEQATVAVTSTQADVVLLATDVPGGLAALAKRVPVVAIASDPVAGLDALEAGAAEVWVRCNDVTDLAWRACAAATADAGWLGRTLPARPAAGSAAGLILALGAGTGAMASLATVLAGLPSDAAALVVTPLPAGVVDLWVNRMGRRIAVAKDGDRIAAGQVLVAPGHRHLLLRPTPGDGWGVAVKDGPTFYHHRPGMDVLLNSAAVAGPRVVAAVLGGVGPDGVNGLLCVRRAGGRTLVESPDTAACPDLPARALACGAAEVGVPTEQVAAAMIELAGDRRANRAA